MVELSVTGANYCSGTYLIVPIVRHLLTINQLYWQIIA